MAKFNAAALNLTALLEEGKFRKAWKHSNTVADALKIKRGTFTNYSNGFVLEETITPVTTLVRQLLKEKLSARPERADPLIEALRQLYLQGIRNGKWRKPYQCGKRCKFDAGSMIPYLRNDWNDTPKARGYLETLITSLRRHAGKIEPSAQSVQASCDGQPTVNDEAIPAFVLNARNIRQHGAFADPDNVQDTEDLLTLLSEELESRFRHLRRLEIGKRASVLQKLNRSIDRLYEAIERSCDVTESRAAKHLASSRKDIL